ncbi:hypothetical protein M5V91_24300 [Cytobacillus pseudoceanisediminis]|nr:hypothetical protein [Cytobacillus pseudoceanisediminis]UQX53781.1 hypothetical protein M5V91_24300 [Cytobacillus pseudoceanisediminis]
MNVKEKSKQTYEVANKGKSLKVKQETLKIDKAAFFEKREITGLPLMEILKGFDMKYEFKDGNLHLYY